MLVDGFELGWRLIRTLSNIPGTLESIPESTRGNIDFLDNQCSNYSEEIMKLELPPSPVIGISKDLWEQSIRPYTYPVS